LPPSKPGAPGSLFFVRDGAMMVQPFDTERGELTGEAQPVVDEIAVGLSRAYFSISPSGVMAFRSGADVSRYGLYDRTGRSVSSLAVAGVAELALSPDGSKLAFGRQTGPNRDIWLLDIARGVTSRFTTNPEGGNAPIWSPDGKYIVYSSFSSPTSKIFRKLSSGAANEELLYSSSSLSFASDWSRDGRFLIYSWQSTKGPWELWLLPDPGGPSGVQRNPIPYLRTRFNTRQGNFSPDSKWVAYTSDESGRPEAYVRPFPAANEKNGQIQISSTGAEQPRWRQDGKELFFFSFDNRLAAVDISLNPEARAGIPHALFGVSPAVISPVLYRYDVTRDGKNFVTLGYGTESDQNPIMVILNWQSPFAK
jgi:dipeptidyl aminopeptidase/acylaminoacyl peptidase